MANSALPVRRMYLVHKRAEPLTHLQILNSQYNLLVQQKVVVRRQLR